VAKLYSYQDMLQSEIFSDGTPVLRTTKAGSVGGMLLGGSLGGSAGALIGSAVGGIKPVGQAKSLQ
jgi:hypothetical protein